jgi:hypothetical protein
MAYINFRLKTDYEITKDTREKLGQEIISTIYNQRIDARKPCITFMGGASGEGKSLGILRLNEIVYANEIESDPELFLQNQVIYTPFEYAPKFKWILYNKEAKHRKVMVFMESRELVKAKLWYTIINQAIADVNAMSRSVKPLAFTMVSQDISDIDKELRRTINFYGKCIRPIERHTRISFYQIYSTGNIENSKILQKKLHGLVWTPTQRYHIEVGKFIMNLPSKELRKRFEEIDYEKKSGIIMKKLDMLIKVLQKQEPRLSKLEGLIEVVIKDPSMLNWIVTRNRRTGEFKVKSQFAELYDITKQELQDFERQLIKKLKETGMVEEKPIIENIQINEDMNG